MYKCHWPLATEPFPHGSLPSFAGAPLVPLGCRLMMMRAFWKANPRIVMAWTYLSATAAALRNCLSMDFQTARAYGRVLFGSVPAFRNGMLRLVRTVNGTGAWVSWKLRLRVINELRTLGILNFDRSQSLSGTTLHCTAPYFFQIKYIS